MCDVCQVEGKDPKFLNGPKYMLYPNRFYRVFKDKVAEVRLCTVHSIELFVSGERTFVLAHIRFARQIARRTKKENNMDSLFS